MKDKLIELLSSCPTDPEGNRNVAVIAQHLLDNGVVVFDNDVVSPENRPLIQTFAGMPVNEVIGLVKAKQEGRIIVPPCKVGEVIYTVCGFSCSEYKVEKFVWDGVFIWCVASNPAYAPEYSKISRCLSFDLNKTIFLTREEAERKLEQ